MKVSEVDKTSTEYLMSKNVSFGIPYGISPPGLAAQARERGIDWDETDCEKFIDEWFKVYPGVLSMIEGFKAQARREGLVRSKLGRVRYLPGIHSTLPYVRSEAERHAVNHPIQTTAQEVLKRAMIELWSFRSEVQKEGYWEPLLQIHDEVIYEEDEGLFDLVDPIVQLCMEGAMDLKVPIRCGGVLGKNWAELK
jgi:DNA polymerase-1